MLRPPLAQERVRLRGDGRVVVELKAAWHDGTTHLVFEPLEFLEKLAAITPRPQVNLIICHGVLAPLDLFTRDETAFRAASASLPAIADELRSAIRDYNAHSSPFRLRDTPSRLRFSRYSLVPVSWDAASDDDSRVRCFAIVRRVRS